MRRFVWRNKDPAKITHAKMTLVKRALGAKQAHAKTTVSKVEDAALKAMVRVTLMRYEGLGFNVPNSYPLVASVAELIVGDVLTVLSETSMTTSAEGEASVDAHVDARRSSTTPVSLIKDEELVSLIEEPQRGWEDEAASWWCASSWAASCSAAELQDFADVL